MRRFRHDRSGAAAIEFALTAPLLFLFLFGAMSLGRWAWSAAQLRDLTQATARCVLVTPTACGSEARAAKWARANSRVFAAPKLAFASDGCGLGIAATRVETVTYWASLAAPTVRAYACVL
jgi:Flp pilus assembly protein TadG